MFGNRTESGRNNIAGIAIHNRRKALGISQREVADRLRSHGLVIDKNAVQRMESGELCCLTGNSLRTAPTA